MIILQKIGMVPTKITFRIAYALLMNGILAKTASSIRSMSSSSSSAATRIAVAQLCSTNNKRQNLLSIAKCAGWAKNAQAQMLFLPEACGFIGETAAETLSNAEPPIGSHTSKITAELEAMSSIEQQLRETVQRCSEQGYKKDADHNDSDHNDDLVDCPMLECLQVIARESSMWMSIGGLHALTDDNDEAGSRRVYNTHLILDPTGKIQAEYRKIHLFDVDIPGKVRLKESNTTAPGSQLVVCDTPLGRLGLSTCYDVRFPELYVRLVDQGADIILVPSAFTVPTGQAHWHVLLRARAIESQCFLVASAQCGAHNSKRTSYGHSLVVDPWGEIMADAGGIDSGETETPSIVTVDMDLSHLKSVRQRIPVQQHRINAEY